MLIVKLTLYGAKGAYNIIILKIGMDAPLGL